MKHLTGIICLVTSLFFAAPLQARILGRVQNFFDNEHQADSLIVTGNHIKPRMLAELVQYKTKQPILLFDQSGAQLRIYYMSFKNQNAISIMHDEYIDIIRNVNPRQIVIIGDDRVLPSQVSENIRERFATIEVKSTNWSANASALARLFEYSDLPKDFQSFLSEINIELEESYTFNINEEQPIIIRETTTTTSNVMTQPPVETIEPTIDNYSDIPIIPIIIPVD